MNRLPKNLECGPPEDEQGWTLLRKAAEDGSAEAQRNLGCYLCRGDEGIEKDEIQGRYWYLMAAKQGHAEAQYNLGFMLLLGEGGSRDVAEGLDWFRRSAMQDDITSKDAARLLVDVFALGLHGVAKNEAEAERWKKRMMELGETIKDQ